MPARPGYTYHLEYKLVPGCPGAGKNGEIISEVVFDEDKGDQHGEG
jgi:hypothetical protein